MGGPESHHVHVSGRQHLPADLRQSRRAQYQKYAAQHDYDEPLSGSAIVMVRHDGVGRGEHWALYYSGNFTVDATG